MSYILEKPYTEQDYADFIVEYNHKLGLKIESAENAVYALEKNEIIKDGIPVIDENYNQKIYEQRRQQFEQEFFQTSLGWIRRKVSMKDGSKKDFLADLLMPIKTGMEMGNNINIITYSEPDYEIEPTQEYMESLQEIKIATPEFISECLIRTVQDFGI